jgi:hypothetical protein
MQRKNAQAALDLEMDLTKGEERSAPIEGFRIVWRDDALKSGPIPGLLETDLRMFWCDDGMIE